MDLHPLTEKALDCLFSMKLGRPINPETVKDVFERACDEMEKEALRHQFMPIINEIWRIA